MTPEERPYIVPVLLGTTREGRRSFHAAKVVHAELSKRQGVVTELIDIQQLDLPTDDAGEQIKDEDLSQLMKKSDGLVIVTPEYNHGYPGMLKHVLDSNLKEYIHKPCGIVGVSAGSFGGARVIENLLPVLRELGLVTIFWDVNFSNVKERFDDDGNLVAEEFLPRIEKFLDELLWMAKTLRYGRDHIEVGQSS